VTDFDLNGRTLERLHELTTVHSAVMGHVMNALIDLDTGTKADAKRTLQAAQKINRDYYEAMKARLIEAGLGEYLS
jgi:hypothetical protein